MGRVRRYKKVKAMDPFAKSKSSKVKDKDKNLPPDVKNHQAQRLNNLQGEKYERAKAAAGTVNIHISCGSPKDCAWPRTEVIV